MQALNSTLNLRGSEIIKHLLKLKVSYKKHKNIRKTISQCLKLKQSDEIFFSPIFSITLLAGKKTGKCRKPCRITHWIILLIEQEDDRRAHD